MGSRGPARGRRGGGMEPATRAGMESIAPMAAPHAALGADKKVCAGGCGCGHTLGLPTTLLECGSVACFTWLLEAGSCEPSIV